jgi:cephalosporin-C deacetylase-like acetyl esterase
MKLWVVSYRRARTLKVQYALVRAKEGADAIKMVDAHLRSVYDGHGIKHIIIAANQEVEDPMIILINGYVPRKKRK